MGDGETGASVVRGWSVPGDWNDRENTAATGTGGAYHSGDLGYCDERGHVHFVGRIKEMIRSGGINVAPAEIESFLMTHPAVREAIVVGLPDPHKNELVGALVRLRDGATLSEQELREYCRARIAAFKVPQRIRFVSEAEVPRTSTGKVNKRRIIEVYLNVVEWGPGIYGAGAAAEHYFHKPALRLSATEAARLAAVLPLGIEGRVISTTEEHTFYVRGAGWRPAKELKPGDELSTPDGRWVPVESVGEPGPETRVYNLRVADYHTYFVGCQEWGFSVWAHNNNDCVKVIKDGNFWKVEAKGQPTKLFTDEVLANVAEGS